MMGFDFQTSDMGQFNWSENTIFFERGTIHAKGNNRISKVEQGSRRTRGDPSRNLRIKGDDLS
jgi:hypothetical protein